MCAKDVLKIVSLITVIIALILNESDFFLFGGESQHSILMDMICESILIIIVTNFWYDSTPHKSPYFNFHFMSE